MLWLMPILFPLRKGSVLYRRQKKHPFSKEHHSIDFLFKTACVSAGGDTRHQTIGLLP